MARSKRAAGRAGRRDKDAGVPDGEAKSAPTGQLIEGHNAGPSHVLVPGDAYVTPAVRGAAAWAWRIAIIVIVTGGIVVGMMHLSLVVVPVLVAVLLASLMMPIVNWLTEKSGMPRALAVALTLLVIFGAVGFLFTMAVRAVGTGIIELYDKAVDGLNELITWLAEGPLELSQDQLQSYLDQAIQQVETNASSIIAGAVTATTTVGQVFAGALIALFCLFFFLRDGRTIWTWVVGLTPHAARPKIDGAALRGWINLGQYARMQILVAFIDGVGIGLGAWILGVPLALPLGLLVFLGAFIPIVGAVLTGSIAVLVALVDGGFWNAVIMLAIVLGVQQIEGNVLQPFLMGKALKLHPVAVLLAVTAGTLLGGIVGALLAVPVMAVANAVMLYLHGRDNAPPEVRPGLDRATARMQTYFRKRRTEPT